MNTWCIIYTHKSLMLQINPWLFLGKHLKDFHDSLSHVHPTWHTDFSKLQSWGVKYPAFNCYLVLFALRLIQKWAHRLIFGLLCSFKTNSGFALTEQLFHKVICRLILTIQNYRCFFGWKKNARNVILRSIINFFIK